MRRGIKVLIVAVVALGTNFGLHAAFGWCTPNHWRSHHDHHHHGHFNHSNDYNDHGSCAYPWNCAAGNASSSNDTLK